MRKGFTIFFFFLRKKKNKTKTVPRADCQLPHKTGFVGEDHINSFMRSGCVGLVMHVLTISGLSKTMQTSLLLKPARSLDVEADMRRKTIIQI